MIEVKYRIGWHGIMGYEHKANGLIAYDWKNYTIQYVCPSQRNATFILHCLVFDLLWRHKKKVLDCAKTNNLRAKWVNGDHFLFIRFLFVRSSGFGLMSLPRKNVVLTKQNYNLINSSLAIYLLKKIASWPNNKMEHVRHAKISVSVRISENLDFCGTSKTSKTLLHLNFFYI